MPRKGKITQKEGFSGAGTGLTSWLSFVMTNCDVVTFPLVSWVRCGSSLYRFLIFALFLTFISEKLGLGKLLGGSSSVISSF